MSKEKSSIKSVSLSKSKRFFRGFKSFLSSKKSKRKSISQTYQQELIQQPQPQEDSNDVGIAVTLTTEINQHQQQQVISIIDPNLNFIPPQPTINSSLSLFQEKAYVHYEPKKAQVTLGTNPELKHIQSSIILHVEQYAWLIQQLQEEQNICHFLNTQYQQPLETSMLGIMTSPSKALLDIKHSTTFGKRLIRFVQQRNRMVTPPHRRQCIFMLPKSLLLQAAAHIPLAKPLPPIQTLYHPILSQKPFEIISDSLHKKLTRYARSIALCTHELLFIQQQQQQDLSSPPSSLISKKNSVEFVKIQCADCHVPTGLETILLQQQQPKHSNDSNVLSSTISQRLNSIMMMNQSIMFPVSYVVYNTVVPPQQQTVTNTSTTSQSQQEQQQQLFMSSAVQVPTESNHNHPMNHKSVFDSLTRKQKPHAFSAFQYIPPDKTMSSDDISSISEYSGMNVEEEDEEDDNEEEDDEEENFTPQKYGYVALDNEHEEILVVFPGMPLSYNMFENASFQPVPWLEIETIASIPPMSERKKQQYQMVEEDLNPWVLECALTAWHRCEMKVVTLLMRLCATLPSHYKVVILGYSLGGGKKCL